MNAKEMQQLKTIENALGHKLNLKGRVFWMKEIKNKTKIGKLALLIGRKP